MSNNDENIHSDFITSLEELKVSSGWKIIKDVMDRNIKDAEEDMFDSDKKLKDPVEENDRVDSLRRKRNERVNLRDLPKELLRLYSENPTGFKKDFDPYEK